MRKSLFAASMLALTVAVAPACATKKFVRTEVGNVNSKVDTLGGSLEETQERTRQNEARIGAVDTKAEAAARSATEARAAADNAASMAKDVDSRLGTRIDTVEAAKRYLYEQHQVPLHKINVISYGEEKPVAPNNTRAGRAQNRRVVVKVLS